MLRDVQRLWLGLSLTCVGCGAALAPLEAQQRCTARVRLVKSGRLKQARVGIHKRNSDGPSTQTGIACRHCHKRQPQVI